MAQAGLEGEQGLRGMLRVELEAVRLNCVLKEAHRGCILGLEHPKASVDVGKKQ